VTKASCIGFIGLKSGDEKRQKGRRNKCGGPSSPSHPKEKQTAKNP
jgi:hypothetical protein